jgi:hypothetical protein
MMDSSLISDNNDIYFIISKEICRYNRNHNITPDILCQNNIKSTVNDIYNNIFDIVAGISTNLPEDEDDISNDNIGKCLLKDIICIMFLNNLNTNHHIYLSISYYPEIYRIIIREAQNYYDILKCKKNINKHLLSKLADTMYNDFKNKIECIYNIDFKTYRSISILSSKLIKELIMISLLNKIYL